MIFNSKLLAFKLSKRLSRCGGRNNTGRITVRHKIGGLKRRTRIIDYFHTKLLPGLYTSTVYLPRKRSSASVFEHSDISYTLAPSIEHEKSVKLVSCNLPFETINPQNRVFTRLKFIKKVGFRCFNVQFFKSSKSRIASAPGTSIKILRQGLLFYIVRIPSGEIRRLPSSSYCSVGRLLPPASSKFMYKAGFSRLMGFRPTVRGVAMNPVDHPHGGNTSPGKNSVSPWAKFSKAKFNFTRNFRKPSTSIILYRRYIKKKF
jgi:large subunit ribosomal protein L2